MTGLENVQFLARIYGEDTERVVDFVEDFAELGPSLRLPWGTYSSGMRARLAFSVSMAIEFDTYLIDEITAVGDASFKAKCHAVFRERRARARVIMVSHAMKTLRDYCDMGLVLHRGRLTLWEDIEDAIADARGADGPVQRRRRGLRSDVRCPTMKRSRESPSRPSSGRRCRFSTMLPLADRRAWRDATPALGKAAPRPQQRPAQLAQVVGAAGHGRTADTAGLHLLCA